MNNRDAAASVPTEIGTRSRVGMSRNERSFIDLLRRHFDTGTLHVHSGGRRYVIGRGAEEPAAFAPDCTLRVNDSAFFDRVLTQGNLGMGEAYMAGEFDVDGGKLEKLLRLLLMAGLDHKIGGDWRFLLRYGAILIGNRLVGNMNSVRKHYDIGEELFDTFLTDRYQVYSCGYAYSTDDDIDTLQQQKLERICRKLEARPGQRVLDIGCGKGGLLIHAALHYGVSGTGVTNSRAHYERARENARKYGVAGRVTFLLDDYAAVEGKFDRIVSVGMLEHLQEKEYKRYFGKIADTLSLGGRGLVHAVGCNTRVNSHDPFIQKYIFPDSDTPKLSAIATWLENNRLAILDVENMVRHYGVTATRWLEAFRANAHTLDETCYDRSFKRMWEYYLCCCVAAAYAGEQALYQVLFTNDYYGSYGLQRV
jgi:cyclopropane-fatty-acyl-phospholipid synthase